MPSSQVQIANMALDVIGTRSTIASLSEGSAEANAISRHWDNALDAVLRSVHWNFARKQIPLTSLKDGTQGQSVPTPWLYEYAYPSDCVLVRYIMPMIQISPVTPGTPAGVSPMAALGNPVKFIPGTDLDINGNPINVLLTDQPQAIGVYTFRNTNTAMWDALFVQEMAAFLGARICLALTGDKNTMKMALSMAQQYSIDAQRSNGNEGLTILDSTPDWMRVRGYASDWAFPDGWQYSYGPQALTLVS
jgi:hypothetical protein